MTHLEIFAPADNFLTFFLTTFVTFDPSKKLDNL
jgi:hypothetical protein